MAVFVGLDVSLKTTYQNAQMSSQVALIPVWILATSRLPCFFTRPSTDYKLQINTLGKMPLISRSMATAASVFVAR
jgi:hypothetical protein